MNFRLTAILFGSVFVLSVVLLIMSFTDDKGAPTDILAEELAAAKPDQIDTVELERESGGKVKIVRGADKEQWNIVEPYKAKADPVAVNEIIGAILKAKPTAFSELTGNPALHGLQPAGVKVTLRAGDKASTINLGEITIGGDKAVVFVTTSARPKRPMAVPRRALASLFQKPNSSGPAVNSVKWTGDFRARAVFAADTRGAGDDVTGIVLKARNGSKVLSLNQTPRGWKFVSPDWGDADPTGDAAASPGTFTGVRPLLGALTSLQALTPADFVDAGPQDLAKYGLNEGNPDRVEVRLTNKDKVETVAFIGKKDDAPPPKLEPGATPQTSKWWVMVQGQPGVIRANAGDLSGLIGVIENPDPLRDRNLLSIEKTRINGLDLANGATKLRKLGQPLDPWKLYGNPAAGDPSAVSIPDVDRVVNALMERRTIKSYPAANEANFGPAAVTVKVWADGFEANPDAKAEPKEKGKPINITFGKKEGELINVKRVSPEGTTTYFLMPEKIKIGSGNDSVDLLQIASKSRLDLLDRDLPKFSSTNVTKLAVSGAVNFDVDRDDKADGSAGNPVFRFAADAKGAAGQVYKKGDQADTQAIMGMLDILATTPSVTRFVDELPTPEKLAEYGLGPNPRLKVTIGLTSTEDKERGYDFGKETADPDLVYAQLRGKKAVFALPKFIYDKFNADLRNKHIFKVNPAEVAKIEIQAWGNVLGTPVDVVFAKKDGVWVSEKGPVKDVDQAKVAAFLNALSSLQVRTFTNDLAPDPKFGLLDPKQFFVVTLVKPDGQHHLHLRVGGPADPNGTTIYALTNRVPNGQPIVTVDAAPFKPYKEGPAAFAK